MQRQTKARTVGSKEAWAKGLTPSPPIPLLPSVQLSCVCLAHQGRLFYGCAHGKPPPQFFHTGVLQMAAGKHRQVLEAPKPWAQSAADLSTLASAEHRERPTTCSTQNLSTKESPNSAPPEKRWLMELGIQMDININH